jgi:hypothetical protein
MVMSSTAKFETHKAIGWLLVGLTVLPLAVARAESPAAADAQERLAWLLARHDARELINLPAGEQADCAADEEDKQ